MRKVKKRLIVSRNRQILKVVKITHKYVVINRHKH